MIPNRTWQQFIKAKENKDLSLTEQKRKYSDERKRFDNQQNFINSGLFIQGLKVFFKEQKQKTKMVEYIQWKL